MLGLCENETEEFSFENTVQTKVLLKQEIFYIKINNMYVLHSNITATEHDVPAKLLPLEIMVFAALAWRTIQKLLVNLKLYQFHYHHGPAYTQILIAITRNSHARSTVYDRFD